MIFISFSVSSVLNRDTREFGKKNLFDGCEETCWNSDQVNIIQNDLHCNIYIFYHPFKRIPARSKVIMLKGLYHRRVFAVCLQSDPESYE